MPEVVYERAWLRMKEEILRKPSHGQRELLQVMAVIEVECASAEPDYDPTPRGAAANARPSDDAPARSAVMASH